MCKSELASLLLSTSKWPPRGVAASESLVQQVLRRQEVVGQEEVSVKSLTPSPAPVSPISSSLLATLTTATLTTATKTPSSGKARPKQESSGNGHGTSAGFCGICNKFVSNRTNHKYVHSQVKFKCKICGYLYSRKDTLKDHIRGKHHSHLSTQELNYLVDVVCPSGMNEDIFGNLDSKEADAAKEDKKRALQLLERCRKTDSKKGTQV